MSVIAKSSLFAICCVPLLSVTISAQLQVVEIEQPQFAKSVAGVVVDPSGAALPGVTVEERSEDWKTVLRSTKTDENGRFHFAPSRNKPSIAFTSHVRASIGFESNWN